MSAGDPSVRTILIVDDEPESLGALVEYLRAPHLHIMTCSEIEAAECLMDHHGVDVLVTDLEVANLGGLKGIRLIRHAAACAPELEVVVLSDGLTPEQRDLAMALGVTEPLEYPKDRNRLRDLIADAPRARGRATGKAGGEVTHIGSLEEVLESHGISAVLQPIFHLDSALPVPEGYGVEGLARGPEGSVLRDPEIFLAYASKKERLLETELQCIEAVLDEARHLSRVGKLFINVRPRSLSTPGFAMKLVERVLEHGFRPRDIVLELTEQQSILDQRAFGAILNALREDGFGLALDDFGNGFANLHLVQQLPLDYLKIDGFFCRNIENDPRKQSLVRSIVEMARGLGIATIVEAVETESELEAVGSLGASLAQGTYLSPPVPGSELAKSFSPRKATDGGEDSSSSEPEEWLPVRGEQDRVDHEISNLLTAIALYAAQSMKRVGTDHALYEDLRQILSASEEAIALKES
ncbi:MAG: EAL domain-containing protein [bacterium]|nr:EAL domain-containing protein [bacterium]